MSIVNDNSDDGLKNWIIIIINIGNLKYMLGGSLSRNKLKIYFIDNKNLPWIHKTKDKL